MKLKTCASPLLSKDDWVRLRSWYRFHGRHNLPWRSSSDPWGILVAEILLHRTRADAAEKIYPSVMREFPNPATVIAKKQNWIELTRTLGLHWRSQQFLNACKELVERHLGEIPSYKDTLLHLPGVGHYIASTVRCFGFGIPEVIVDSNTIRLASRISGLAMDSSRHRRKDIHKTVARLAEDSSPPDAKDNYALLDVASLVCLPRSPDHSVCPLLPSCVTGLQQRK